MKKCVYFWGWRFKDGSILDGKYAQGSTYDEALAYARKRFGDEVDPASVKRWDGVL